MSNEKDLSEEQIKKIKNKIPDFSYDQILDGIELKKSILKTFKEWDERYGYEATIAFIFSESVLRVVSICNNEEEFNAHLNKALQYAEKVILLNSGMKEKE